MPSAYETLLERVGTYADLMRVSSLLSWDQETMMPPGGIDERAEQLSTIDRLAHDHLVADEMADALDRAAPEADSHGPDGQPARLVRYIRRLFDRERRVPGQWVAEFSRVTSQGQLAWQNARKASDFAAFRPFVERVFDLRRQYAEFFAPYTHVYDPCLHYYEPDLSTAEVKAVFAELRPAQVELVQAIADRGRPVDDSVLHQTYPEAKQWEFGVEVARAFGYDFERGRQDRSAHPFTIHIGIGDVRITTRFLPQHVGSALFSTMHEVGHALYMQGADPALRRTEIAEGASYAIHESQSRLWENLVGRSLPFWKAYYPRLQSAFPGQLASVPLEDFYRAINRVQRSLIRVEADEATYNLHIMLRFELELDLMEKRLEARDLPEAWNAKVKEYLGLTPPSDREGVLQDIHWSSGYVGYFPTYALGNLISVQIWQKILQEMPDLPRQIEQARFGDLRSWLQEKIHRYGALYAPLEVVRRVTGQGLQAKPYLQYLQTKYGEIYGL